jgi:hypothetical protein
MDHTIVKIGIESYVQLPITMDQIVEDGRMVRVDEVEAGDEGEGMHHIVRIQDGKGVGLVADQTTRDIYLNEANGTVNLILGGDMMCSRVIIAL